jgi:hypothetical protein
MRRQEINALLSAGTDAERAGRKEDAKACAEALIHALREARAKRKSDDGGTRAADNEAISWATETIQACATATPS